ncbi:MAG: alanine--tRNA ligase [Alphaproteobacteria bacterium]|nr:alanine--tRNA ligase [Alphaproteobacteria bacterium]
MKTVADIREAFLSYFEKQGHTRVASSALVPHNDPTMMFTNSGMVQFKNVFTGVETRPYTRATTAQKCVRAGGKHNDLDNVGYTARHHTFFEMMGNFSFGDYFKEEAINYAWELVTKILDMPKDRLLVTVHTSDEEAATLWKKIAGFPDSKIIRIPTDDNFWQMGDTGPCGPCSEIFFDQGDKLKGGPPGSPDEDGDRYLEFWNNVFMQFEQFNDGRPRIPLPKQSVDTGLGLERTAALIQGKTSNYDIDLLRKIIEHSADITGVSPDGAQAASHRVIADHLRSAAFLLADGVMPSNEGRGYVLRRIMRRGMRHAHLLGAKEPLMYRLFPTLLSMMSEAYPEIKRAEGLITETLKNEETRFKRTLETGLRLLDEQSGKLGDGQIFSGETAFKLYDTYGFPLDLTQDALKARNIKVDVDGFNSSMEKQKAEARKNWAGSGEKATDTLWFSVLEKNGPTEFLGYEKDNAEAVVQAIVKDGALIETAKAGETVGILTNQTPFYGESGGQVGDCGIITVGKDTTMIVTETQKYLGKLFVHYGRIERGSLKKGDAVDMRIDTTRRNAIRANHSATHLLHEALRELVGTHIAQKGSLNAPDRTRFDISQPVALTDEQLRAVEDMVNAEIQANTPVVTRLMPVEEAIESGAMALFGEKYDAEVRVVSMGTQKEGANHSFSVELCGGTHVKQTGDIGLFKIISESAVSAGVRRVEAVTGFGALAYLRELEEKVQTASAAVKASPAELVDRVKALADDKKKLEQEVANLRRQLATGGTGAPPEIKEINGVKFISKVLADYPPGDLKPMVDDLKSKLGSGVIALISTNDGKASIVVGVTADLTGRFNAVDLVKLGAEALGGKGGGGRPDMAQAGGTNGAAANDAVSSIEKALAG